MSDDNMEQEAEPGGEEPSIFDQPEGVDWFLADQIHMADAYKVEQGITLNVGGVLVSGTLISGRQYFEELGHLTRTATKGTHSEEVGAIMGDNRQMYMEVYPERKEGEDFPYSPKSYIHLRDAHVIGSNGFMSGEKGTLWRGKLSAVDGYFFGSISID